MWHSRWSPIQTSQQPEITRACSTHIGPHQKRPSPRHAKDQTLQLQGKLGASCTSPEESGCEALGSVRDGCSWLRYRFLDEV